MRHRVCQLCNPVDLNVECVLCKTAHEFQMKSEKWHYLESCIVIQYAVSVMLPFSLAYHIKIFNFLLHSRNECVCEGDAWHLNVPFGGLLFPRVGAELLHSAFGAAELEEIKQRRQHEYNSFLDR